MYTAINGVALAIVAKAGTQSFSEASGAKWYINNEHSLEFPIRVFFIRNPFERLESCYSFFCQLSDENTTQIIIPIESLVSWEVFIDYILVNDDEHWEQQTETLLYKGELTPTHIFKFEDVSKWWPNFFSVRLPHENKSSRKLVGNYREDDLKDYYKEDFIEWNSAREYKEIEAGVWPLQ
jgi:hypothetical protein